MKPAARIHLIKQREYFKTCPDGMQRPGMGQFSPLNPSWTSPDMNFGGGGGGNGGAATSYFYGTGIGEPVPEETYGSSLCTTLDALLYSCVTNACSPSYIFR